MLVLDATRLLKTLGDPTRLRLLRLMAGGELSVMELAEVTQLSQSRISNHLKMLREEELVQERREGPWRYYRLDPDRMPGAARELWSALAAQMEDEDEHAADRARLEHIFLRRQGRNGAFFEAMAERWDEIRSSMFGDSIAREVLRAFVPRDLVVADIGAGTGYVVELFADRPRKLIAIDLSDAMLSVAREKVCRLGLTNVEFRLGDAHTPPLQPEEADFATLSMVLHHLEDPARAIQNLAPGLKPSGRLLIADFTRHQETWLRVSMAHRWLGFARAEIEAWLDDAGMRLEAWAVLPGRPMTTPDERRVQVPDGFAALAVKR